MSKITECVANSVDPDETPHFAASHWVYTICLGLSGQVHTVKYNMVRVLLRQTDKIMTISSVITNRLSITMVGLIIGYLFSSD